MKIHWELDDSTVVEAHFGAFGKERVLVNGRAVVDRRSLRRKGELPFQLPDGRSGAIKVTPRMVGTPDIELRVAGRLYAETPKQSATCASCQAFVKPNDRFCEGCGHVLPTAEQRAQHKQVAEATSTMRGLSVLFVISGALMFFVTKSQATDALAALASMDASSTVPLDGATYTVAELREQLEFEPWGTLVTNLLLAAVMFGLAIWGKRSPLPAVLVATATYAAVIVVNAILDPRTIAQGLIVKIIVIAFFVKGIKAALALRNAHA